MNIFIDNRQSVMEIRDDLYDLIENVIKRTIEEEGLEEEVEVSVVLVDNKQIKELNCDFRGVDHETDVLSFPAIDYEEDEQSDINLDTGDLILGDIAISVEKAAEQAQEYGHSFYREIGFLTAHGMFHLLGYDHETEEEAVQMRSKEENVLASLGLTRD